MFICTVQYLWQFTCTLYDNMYTMHTVNTVREDEEGERGEGERGEGERGSDKREGRGREGRERERRKEYMYTQTSRH